MVLDTKSMASKYLLGRCQPSSEGKCLRGERSFPLLKFITDLPFEKHLTALQIIQEVSFKLKCYSCNQGRWMV